MTLPHPPNTALAKPSNCARKPCSSPTLSGERGSGLPGIMAAREEGAKGPPTGTPPPAAAAVAADTTKAGSGNSSFCSSMPSPRASNKRS